MTEIKKLDKEIKELALWRLESVPKHFKISIGSKGTFSRDELKKRIEDEDDVGRIFVDMQIGFIRAVAKGEFTKALAE